MDEHSKLFEKHRRRPFCSRSGRPYRLRPLQTRCDPCFQAFQDSLIKDNGNDFYYLMLNLSGRASNELFLDLFCHVESGGGSRNIVSNGRSPGVCCLSLR